MRSILTRLPLLFLLALAAPALASDGVLEINQTCAVQTGCFSGDTPGFPVTITEPGTSYVLTSRLIVPNENTDAIVVSTNDVGIDLNNFAIIRSGCEGVAVCTLTAGSGSGVEHTSLSNSRISVKNGSVLGMGGYGVNLGGEAEVTNLRVRRNGVDGISALSGSIVSGNTASQNGSLGIFTTSGSIVSGNTALQNGSDGISVGLGSIVSGNTAILNGSGGIRALASSATVMNNTATRNGEDGIECLTGCTVAGNTVEENGTTSSHDGIEVGAGSQVYGNTVRGHTGLGLRGLTIPFGYRDNVFTENNGGNANLQVNSAGADLGGNICGAPIACP